MPRRIFSSLTQGQFSAVLDDPEKIRSARKVIFCSGKIYYQLITRRQQINDPDIAIVRLEQLYPFPEQALQTIIGSYKKATSWLWVQEEPENMGAWQYIAPRLSALLGEPIDYVGRKAAASPAAETETYSAGISPRVLGIALAASLLVLLGVVFLLPKTVDVDPQGSSGLNEVQDPAGLDVADDADDVRERLGRRQPRLAPWIGSDRSVCC